MDIGKDRGRDRGRERVMQPETIRRMGCVCGGGSKGSALSRDSQGHLQEKASKRSFLQNILWVLAPRQFKKYISQKRIMISFSYFDNSLMPPKGSERNRQGPFLKLLIL